MNTATPDSGGAQYMQPSTRPIARIRRTLVVIYLLVLAILLVAGFRIAHNVHESALEAIRQNNQMLARLLEEHIARTFGEVDKVILGAVEQFTAQGGLQRLDEKAVHDDLRRRQNRLPQVASLGAALPDGRMHARATEYPIQPSGIDEREDFIYLRDHAEDAPYIGNLVQNPYGSGHLIYVSRRITLPDRRFGGIVRGAVATEYLIRFYADLQLPPGTIITLFKKDGNPIFRHPHVGNLIQFNLSGTAAFKNGRPVSRKGIFSRTSPADGQEHLVAYRWFADESLGVFVGMPTEGALAASKSYALRIAAGALLVAIVIGALFGLIFRAAGK